MLIAGVIGHQGMVQTSNLISSILASTGKKVSVTDSKSLTGLGLTRVKEYLNELEKSKVEILVLKIDIADFKADAIDGIHFDIMIYTDKADGINRDDNGEHERIMRWIFSLMDDKGIIIANMDEEGLINLLQASRNHIVTYGFNSKASMTTSSVGDTVFEDGFICCLQRTISTKSGRLVEPQEYMLNVNSNQCDGHSILAAAAFAIVNGIDLNILNADAEK